ncbi:MAG: putative collagen-binding domain-containing protein [Armatimonadota bacterium]
MTIRRRWPVFLGILLLTSTLAALGADDRAADGLRIHPDNPRYLTYNGEPFFIIGSGMESHCDTWSQTIPQWRAYLDMLQRNGFNRVRFFLWWFCWKDELLPTFSPWALRSAEQFDYDLTRFNPAYWDFMKQLLTLARERDIVFEYNLFDYCCLEDRRGSRCWTRNPLSALNNNGGPLPGPRGKPDIYAFADYADLDLFEKPFDASWPWQKQNQWYQQLYVKHTIDQLTAFPNLYWEIMNEQGWGKVEPNGPEWTRHWLAFLDRHDPNRHLRSLNAADVYDALPGLDIVCTHPIPYYRKRELNSPERAVNHVQSHLKFGKPVSCDETGYFPPQASTDDKDWRTFTPEQLANERRAFWYAFVAGGHWTATCWQDFDERDTHRWIRHLANFVRRVPYWRMDPHDDLVEGGHCLARPGEHYVVYLGNGGTTSIDLQGHAAEKFEAQWLDPRTGTWHDADAKQNGQRVTLTAPSEDDWVLWMRAR